MHEDALARAAQPAPVVVLGMLLRPLSIGHILLFHRENLMDAATSGRLTAQQLSSAVLICCQNWAEISTIRQDWLLGVKMWAWRQRVARLAKRHQRDFPALPYSVNESRKLIAYLSAGCQQFPASEIERPDRSSPRTPGTPFLLNLQQWLMVTFGLTESAAWDYPFALAKMRWAAHWEMQGGMEIANGVEAALDDYAAGEGGRLLAEYEKNQRN